MNRFARDCSLNSPWVLKSDERKRDSASIILQFNLTDFSIFEEEILDIPFLDIHGKVPNIDPAIRHDGSVNGAADTEWGGGDLQALRSLLSFKNSCGSSLYHNPIPNPKFSPPASISLI